MIAAQLNEYTKNHRIVHFKWMNCMICELHHSKVFFKDIGIGFKKKVSTTFLANFIGSRGRKWQSDY